ncbi:hypothetical protein PV419_50480 [Streptomyces sp. ME19-01-6]|nr:hypothetical protein [Streptomyces sp. ME19-01-6]
MSASSARGQARASASCSTTGTTAVPGPYDMGTGLMYATSSGRPVRRGFSGIHTRSADGAGITLGKNVARYVVRNAGRLLTSR